MIKSLLGKKKTPIPKKILEELFYLCIKEVHFLDNDEIYIQKHGAAMGFLLGPFLRNIFMTLIEEEVISMLACYLCC